MLFAGGNLVEREIRQAKLGSRKHSVLADLKTHIFILQQFRVHVNQ